MAPQLPFTPAAEFLPRRAPSQATPVRSGFALALYRHSCKSTFAQNAKGPMGLPQCAARCKPVHLIGIFCGSYTCERGYDALHSMIARSDAGHILSHPTTLRNSLGRGLFDLDSANPLQPLRRFFPGSPRILAPVAHLETVRSCLAPFRASQRLCLFIRTVEKAHDPAKAPGFALRRGLEKKKRVRRVRVRFVKGKKNGLTLSLAVAYRSVWQESIVAVRPKYAVDAFETLGRRETYTGAPPPT